MLTAAMIMNYIKKQIPSTFKSLVYFLAKGRPPLPFFIEERVMTTIKVVKKSDIETKTMI